MTNRELRTTGPKTRREAIAGRETTVRDRRSSPVHSGSFRPSRIGRVSGGTCLCRGTDRKGVRTAEASGRRREIAR